MAKLMGRATASASSQSTAKTVTVSPTAASAYLPPAPLLKKLIRREKSARGDDTVIMSVQTYNKLLEAALSALFDPVAYLEKFADVRDAVRAGKLTSALHHFVTDGYAEGRTGLVYQVDEEWYLQTYPDVALAIKSGKVRNAAHHFELFGFNEGRVPNKSLQKTVAEWRELEKAESGKI